MKYNLLGNKRQVVIDEFHQFHHDKNTSHIVYSVDTDETQVCYTKVGHAETTTADDMLITLHPSTAVTGQLLLCKKHYDFSR
ncbi:hypothetical protein ABWR82_004275 [Salmonella enterica subsp. enterica]|nr:hypothetical protein [Salmonella enterica]